MIGCSRTHVRKQPIIALYFESGVSNVTRGLFFLSLYINTLCMWEDNALARLLVCTCLSEPLLLADSSTTKFLYHINFIVLIAVVEPEVVTSETPVDNSSIVVIGAVIGAVVFLILVAVVIFLCIYCNRDPNAGKPIIENTKPRFEGKRQSPTSVVLP